MHLFSYVDYFKKQDISGAQLLDLDDKTLQVRTSYDLSFILISYILLQMGHSKSISKNLKHKMHVLSSRIIWAIYEV